MNLPEAVHAGIGAQGRGLSKGCGDLQSAADGVPSSYELVGQKKGWKRYRSPRLAELVQDLAAAQEDRETALSGILQVAHLLISNRKMSGWDQ